MGWKILTNTGAVKETGTSAVSTPTKTILNPAGGGSGTYTVPTGCTSIYVELVGGGGSGAGCAASGSTSQCSLGSGGGSGQYAASLISNPASSYAYAVGGGATAPGTGSAGTAGGDTSFGGGIVLARGGGGGTSLAGATGPVAVNSGGGTGSAVGQITQTSSTIPSFRMGGVAGTSIGPGAPGPYGGSILRNTITAGSSGANGLTASGYGGGGCGGVDTNNTARSGGAGGDGLIVITEFYGSQSAIGTFPQQVTAPAFIASGLTGATAVSRYVGATASGAPTSGNFGVGDFVIDQTGAVWVCTAAGSPGTWRPPPGYEIDYAQITSNASLTTTLSTVITGAAKTYDGNTIIEIEFFAPFVDTPATINAYVRMFLADGGSAFTEVARATSPAAASNQGMVIGKQRITPSAGSHTYSVQAQTSTSTGTIHAGAGSGAAVAPSYMRITRV